MEQNSLEVNKEKQIEEMCKLCPFYEEGKCNLLEDEAAECNFNCDMCDFARTLYNAGYRKQSEGEWIDRHNGDFVNPIYMCSVCGKGTLLKPHINELYNMEMVQALSPFCPNCGAKMKGANNDN